MSEEKITPRVEPQVSVTQDAWYIAHFEDWFTRMVTSGCDAKAITERWNLEKTMRGWLSAGTVFVLRKLVQAHAVRIKTGKIGWERKK